MSQLDKLFRIEKMTVKSLFIHFQITFLHAQFSFFHAQFTFCRLESLFCTLKSVFYTLICFTLKFTHV